jgi:hypothetical protein
MSEVDVTIDVKESNNKPPIFRQVGADCSPTVSFYSF